MPSIDFTRKQIAPEALRIIERTGHKVEPGYKDIRERDLSPKWEGLSLTWWVNLRRDNAAGFIRLIHICEEDFPTFCALMLNIYNKHVSRDHSFILNKAQQYAWNAIAKMLIAGKPVFLIILKARQLGFSTLVIAFILWQAWREKSLKGTIIGHKKPLITELVKTISRFYDGIPDLEEIRPKLRNQSKSARVPKHELFFSTKAGKTWLSEIVTMLESDFEARGGVTKTILASEYGFYKEPQATMDALLPSLPPVGSPARKYCSVIIESTPNGQNDFYDLWRDAVRDKDSPESEWFPLFVPWFIADDIYWKSAPEDWVMSREDKKLQKELSKVRIADFDGVPVSRGQMYWRYCEIFNKKGNREDAEAAFNMEYPSDDENCFLLYQSKSIFKQDMKYLQSSIVEMEEIGRNTCRNNYYYPGNFALGNMHFEPLGNPFRPSNNIQDRKPPIFVPHRQGDMKVWEAPQPGHIYTGGTDAGDMSDNAVTEIVCVTCGQQAAELIVHGKGVEYLCDHSVAMMRWYNNALWLPEINNIGSTLLKRALSDWMYPNVCREEKFDEIGVKKNKFGWSTTEHNKPILISTFQMLIRERHFRIASRDLRGEMSTFEEYGITHRGNARSKGSGSSHDDTVMAMALALKAVAQSPKFLSEMSLNRHEVIPSAAALGLNNTPRIVENRREQQTQECIARLLGEDPLYDLSMDPLMGNSGGSWLTTSTHANMGLS
jgi:hypothetical protein